MRSQKLDVRGLQTHVQEWGEPGSPKLFMLHGWMDCGATYKYMMPYLEEHYHVIAPDLRGFGETQHDPNGYWFPDYIADLEVLLDHFSPTGKVNLVGHSMGGNIVLMYAGIRPDRVARVLSLEGLGLPPSQPSDAVGKYQKWMREILSDEPSKIYPNANILKHSIYKGNPTLPDHVIEELADLWGKPVGNDGAYMLKHDHKHRYTNPIRYNIDDATEIWKSVRAKVGLVMADSSMLYQKYNAAGRVEEAKTALGISADNYYLVENSNHMLHMEQSEQSAQHVLHFFAS